MKKLDVKNGTEINTDSSKVWEVVGENCVNIADWQRGINKSWNNETVEKKFEDAPTGGRFIDLGSFGIYDERIIHFDSDKHEIIWSASGTKLPKFVTQLQNEIHITNIEEGKCRITSNITADMRGLGSVLMGSLLKKNFTKTVDGFLVDLKTYVETGQISEFKQKELAEAKNR